MRAVFACAALAILVGCGKGQGGGGGGGDDSIGGVVAGWQKAGLSPSAFEPTDGKALADGKCRAGTVAGLEAVLCVYADAPAAEKAKTAGFARVGEAQSGTAVTDGRILLVLADRHNVDPNGKKFNDVLKTFRHK